MRRTLAALFLLLAATALAGTISIPGPIKTARPGISQEAHQQCLDWWEDWAAQNKAEMEKMDALEQHCAFVHYMQTCGEVLSNYERPGSPPGATVPSFSNYQQWDESMTALYQDRCFEFSSEDSEVLDGKAKGETKRVLRLVNTDGDQLGHIRRRVAPLRKLLDATFRGIPRPMSKQEVYRKTGTR
jgi:hypothetical protein